MTETIIALLSIVIGIIATLVLGQIKQKLSFGLIGNCMIGVFGSVLFIKSFGRLGFDPASICANNVTNLPLLFINMAVSALGGIFLLLLLNFLSVNIKT